uniref:Uncharacterized protein LOC100182097 n=1 Tax=Phallusia mammillata TaxID=59560 RepID=A0A6F9DI99_9ASCI|nr:uncharacterized protein LOC100182097 [Phallusia mammillata]
MSTAPMIAQHDFCPMCVRMPVMSPYQQCPQYMYYSGMPMAGPDLCRILPGASYVPAAPSAMPYPPNMQVPLGMSLLRQTGGLPPDPGPQAFGASRSNGNRFPNTNLDTGANECTQDGRQTTRSRSNLRGRGSRTQNRTRNSNFSQSRNTSIAASKIKQRYSIYRKQTNSRSKSKEKDHTRSGDQAMPSVEPVELSSIACIEEGRDTDYDSWEEVENEDVPVTNASTWLDDTRMVMEAPALTNRHKHIGAHSKQTTKGRLPMDYTLINDKTFSYVNYNPEMVPLKLDKMWIHSGSPKPQRKSAVGPTVSGTSPQRADSALKTIKPALCIAAASGEDTTGTCEMSIRHLTNDEVYYVVRPKAKPCNENNKTDAASKSCQGCNHVPKCATCCCTVSRSLVDRGVMQAPNQASQVIQMFGDSEIWDAGDMNNKQTPVALPGAEPRARRLSAFANISGGSSSDKHQSPLPLDPNNNNNNENEPTERSKEFWWDRSTDIGYRERGRNVEHFIHPTTLGEDELDDTRISGAFIQEVDDFVVVDTAPKASTTQAIDVNNNESDNKNQQDSLMIEEGNASQDRRKLDVDWNSIRSVVPKEYATRSYTQEGTAEVYDFDSTLGLVSCPGDESVRLATSKHSATSSNGHRPISEQDNAIVAFVERPGGPDGRCENESSTSSLTISLSPSEEIPQVVNTSTRHVEARRVTTPSSKVRPVKNWGKHDVRLLLIATTGSSSPSSTTTWCPPSASTPSFSTTTSVHPHLVTGRTVKSTANEKLQSIQSQKQARSLPSSPKGRLFHLSANKHRSMAASAECIPAVLQQNQQWNTITETPDRELQIDCQDFNKPSAADRYDRRRTDSPDFWRKPSENRHKTYLLTPASSELLAQSPTKDTQADQNVEAVAAISKYGNDATATLTIKPIHQSRASGIPRPKKSKAPQHVHHSDQHERITAKPITDTDRPAVIAQETTQQGKSLLSGTASTSPTSSHTVTPATTPEFGRLGPTGSKTVVKTKRRSSASSRNKRGARKTIITSVNASEKTSKKTDKVKRAPTPAERNKTKEKFFVPAKPTTGSYREPASRHQKLSLSNRVVSGRAPTRRSPRTARSTLSTKHISTEKASKEPPTKPEKSAASQRAMLRSELARVFAAHEHAQPPAVKHTTGSHLPDKSNKTKRPKNTVSTQQTSVENQPDVALPTSTSTVTCVLDTSDVEDVTHGHVHSSIQTIVHKLVKQTTSHHDKPVCSPSLAALREKGLYRFQAEIYQTVVDTSSARVTTVQKRASTAPNSPIHNSTLASSKRSVSLSDVFYDSTVDPSLSVWHTKLQEDQDISSSFIGLLSHQDHEVDSSVNQSASAEHPDEPQSIVQRFRDIHGKGSTYVGFSPPTMTPPEKFLSPQKRVNEDSLIYQANNDRPSLPEEPLVDENLKSMDDTRSSRVLSEDLENEIRKKVEILLHSVKEDSLQSNRGCSSFTANSEKKASVGSARGRKKSLDQSTQTSDLKDQGSPNTAQQSSLKLSVPPKKPPRSNSPSNLSNRIASQELQQTKTVVTTTATSTVNGSPIVPYYPLLTSFSRFSPHRHPHFLSPTFIPVNISQQFYRAPGVAWPNVSTHSQSSDNSIDLSAESQFKTSHTDQSQRRASDSGNVQDMAPSVVMLPATGMLPSYYIPPVYPDAPRPKAPAGRKSKPVLRRRRSFPGPISSSSVAKARLNRRYGLARNYAAVKFAKPTPLALNQSHPVTRPQVVRRPRFARSSLSDDVVFQSIEQRSGAPVFVTKPKTPLPKAADKEAAEKPTKNETNDAEEKKAAEVWLSSGGDTGYTSGATSSGRTTPEAVDSHPERPTQRLDAIPEDSKQQVDTSVQDTSVQDTTKDVSEDHQDVVEDKHSKSKKVTHFQTIKRIKRFMSTKKVGKHDHTVANPEQIRTEQDASEVEDSRMFLRKSKTDTKLPKKSDTTVTHVGKGAAVREIFKKSKKSSIDKGSNSTLKGTEEFKNVSAKIASRPGAETNRPPGPRENYDMKLALLKPSFVAVAPSEIRPVEDQQKNVTHIADKPAPNPGSALDTSIQRTNTRRSVSTPGIRINSETGDVIDEEKSAHTTSMAQHQPMHKILSSTAIDDDSLEDGASQSRTLQNYAASSELQVTDEQLNLMGKSRESTVI